MEMDQSIYSSNYLIWYDLVSITVFWKSLEYFQVGKLENVKLQANENIW